VVVSAEGRAGSAGVRSGIGDGLVSAVLPAATDDPVVAGSCVDARVEQQADTRRANTAWSNQLATGTTLGIVISVSRDGYRPIVLTSS
jgi:hypothetical protein